VTATATTAVASATISRVDFYAGSTLIGTKNSSPYSITWTPTTAGTVNLIVRAFDSNGVSGDSAPVSFVVTGPVLPTAVLTGPVAGSTTVVNAQVNVTATASTTVNGATISRVDFYAGNTLIGSKATAPYSVSWTPTVTGTFNLLARAFDSSGLSGDSVPVAVVVNAVGSPTISLAVAGGGTVIPVASSRILVASVVDSGAIDRVEFYYDTTLIGTVRSAPFTFLFGAPLDVGAHQLSARAVDNLGLATTSIPVPITVTTILGTAPTGTILTPSANSFYPVTTANQTNTINITGTITDTDGTITSVQVFVNGASIGNAAFSGGTWTIPWTPTVLGTASLVAIITDDKTNAFATAPFNVTITDTSSPAIALSISPTTAANPASATLPAGSTRNIVATVTPVSGRAVTRVEFFVNGTKVSEKTTVPYSYRYVAPATTGNYVVSVRATDNTGVARDVQQTFTVGSRVGNSPTVSLLAPTNGAIVVPNSTPPVNLAASAVPAAGGTITSVQFYANGSPLNINSGNAVTAAPYVASFNPTTTGSYVLDAIATDDRGNTTVSNAVTINAAFGTPTIIITAPNANATARATPNVPLNITATATSGTGASVVLVEFLIDGQQVGTRSPASGSLLSTFATTFQWTPTAAQIGTHQLTARVTDTNSLVATSTPAISVSVASIVGTPPSVALTTPVAGAGNPAVIQSASVVNLIASAVATSPATITSVEFFLNDVSIGTGSRESTTNLWRRVFDFSTIDLSAITPDANGRYPVTLYAIARDSNSNQTVSSNSFLVVAPSQSLPPTVSLQSLSGTSVTQGNQFFMFASPSDPDGTVVSLQLYANGALVGGSTVGNPGPQALVTYTANTIGRINLVVVATDDTGNTAVSTPAVPLDVTALRAPSTTITLPSDDSTVTSVSAPVFLEATATSPDPTQIPTVGFFATGSAGNRITITNFATRLSSTSNVYRFVWTPGGTAADTYTVSSSASVGFGAGQVTTNSTQTRKVVVNNIAGIAPTVSFTVQGATTSASSVVLVATANDSDGSVNSVEFYVNRRSVGQAVRDQTGNTWRLTTSLVGLPVGNTEFVALAKDNSGNIAASPTSTINITAATSLAPTISSVVANPTSVAVSRQIQLTSNASDPDGTGVTVQYFANGVAVGQTSNANTSYLVNWTPTVSGTYSVYAVVTDQAGSGTSNTAISAPITVTVRRNNPIQDDTSFIIQSYADISNVTNVNPLVLSNTADQIAAGSTTRVQVVGTLLDDPGFVAPVNLLASYYVLMGQWPTPANYTTLLATARNSLTNAIGQIFSSNEYFAKWGIVPTTALLNSPTSLLPADTFIAQLWAGAGLGAPSALANLQFRNNNVASATLGRGYNVAGLNTAVAEFITLTNVNNTALFAKAKAAALYYQIDRPPTPTDVTPKSITDAIAARVAQLVAMPDDATRIDSVLKDQLYTYRFITFLSQPQSLTVNPRSGAIFTVSALGAPPILYQWLFNGAPIANATNATLSLTNVDSTRTGTYTVVVTTTAGTATSDQATLTLTNGITRVSNISTRGVTNGGNQVLIGGFVVANPAGAPANQTRQMLIRVVGPTLANAPFNVTGVLQNPSLEVYSAAGALLVTNDNWGTQTANAATNATAVTAIQQAVTRVGAFQLPAASQDAAVLATLAPGSYTVQAKGPNANSNGVVLIEVYDATAGNPTATSPRASNVATRGDVGTGGNVLIAGFVINGTASRRMLLRGVGPTLRNFGLGANAVLADPFLTLKDAAGNTIRTNDDWASGDDAASIAAAAASSGAFALANGSKDAAMLVMLAPGSYTLQLSGVGNTTGIGIVEVYDVDP
jgi:hypothetical protein